MKKKEERDNSESKKSCPFSYIELLYKNEQEQEPEKRKNRKSRKKKR